MKKYADKYLLLLLLMGIQIICLTKANLASVIRLLMIVIAISITDSFYKLNNKIWNISLIVINTAILSLSYLIAYKELTISGVIICAVFSVTFSLVARCEKIKGMHQ